MDITILYGTETGNAEMLAEDIQGELEGDHEVDCFNLSDFAPDSFDPARFYLVVCSTYGDGELPGSAQPFAEAMESAKPDLSGVIFAVFGLGDSEYEDTFNGGSKVLSDLLISHNATMIGVRPTHDASGSEMAEDMAFEWAEEVVALAETKFQEVA
jgi:MioC protein